MKTIFNKTLCFSAIAAALTFVHAAKADIVYQNTTGDLSTIFNPDTLEVGDEIILAGGGRSLTNFTFQYTLSGGSATAQLRFYNNDGTPFNGYNTPETMFFDSGTFSIGSGTHTLIFDADFGAGLLLPDSFTWSVQFSNVGVGETAGLDLFNPPTVGNNYNDYWENDGGVWTLKETTNGVPINFGAQVEVVPEPSTMALGLLGCAMGWGFLRRNRR